MRKLRDQQFYLEKEYGTQKMQSTVKVNPGFCMCPEMMGLVQK